MNITEQFLNFTLLGAEWVLWLLVILSVASVAVMIERGLFFHRRQIDVNALAREVRQALDRDDTAALDKKYRGSGSMAARVALAGLGERGRGADAAAEAMNSEKSRARDEHERYLVYLGTLGNNAPFIGLFGTVLGIIQAFQQLKDNPGGGIEVVMAELSEALVATAVGLLVAIPAVIAFNIFNRRLRALLTGTDSVAHVILGSLHGPGKRGEGEGAR